MPEGEPIASNTERKRIPLIRWLIPSLLIGLLAIGYLLATSPEAPETQLEWMSFQQMFKSSQPSPLQRLKYKLESIAEPLLKWYKPNRPTILINVDVISVAAQWEYSSGIGSPISTNRDGTKAWIMKEAELQRMREKVFNARSTNERQSTPLTTTDGSRAQISWLSMIGSATNPPVGTYPVGTIVNVTPKVVAHSIRLDAGVTATEISVATNRSKTFRTNAAVFSRALLPNGGGIVLSAEGKDSSVSANIWIIISAEATDAKGTRIKL